jgi:hypothetical protein
MTLRNIAFATLVGITIAAQSAFAGPLNDDRPDAGRGFGMMMGERGYGMMGPSMMGGNWGGQGWGPGAMMRGGCGMMGASGPGADYKTYSEGRIAFLQAELKIAEAQKPAWNAYADVLRSNSQVMLSMHKQMLEAFRQKDRTSLEWLDLRIQMMKSHLAALEALKPATEALYKVLSPEQRQNADQLLPAMGCM